MKENRGRLILPAPPSNKETLTPKTISRLIDRLEAAREELLTIQRSFEELESLTGSGKIVSRRKLILPVPKGLSR